MRGHVHLTDTKGTAMPTVTEVPTVTRGTVGSTAVVPVGEVHVAAVPPTRGSAAKVDQKRVPLPSSS